jgi:hypothetical protein
MVDKTNFDWPLDHLPIGAKPVRLSRRSIPVALLAIGLLVVSASHATETEIRIQADHVLGNVSRYLTGACIEDVNHEIYGGIYSQLVFGESFQEPAAPPQFPGFSTLGGNWTLDRGRLSIDGDDGPKLISKHKAFRDGAVGVEMLFPDRRGQNAGLIVRVANPGPGADAFAGYEVSLDPAAQSLRLGRHRNNFELIQDVSCEVAVGRWINLEVKLAGPVIEIYVSGKSVLRQDDGRDSLPGGTIGLRAWHCRASFRNLWAKTGPQAQPLAFGPPEETPQVSRMWRAVRRGDAAGHFRIVSERPFTGVQSQYVGFDSGMGGVGVENQGLNRWGMNFVAEKPYEGYVWARAEKPVTLFATLESRDGSRLYAETPLAITGSDWQRLEFTLTPNAADKAGRFALTLKQPGSVTLGHAFLQPGEWGRFRGLPVRRDVAQGLIDQGITVLRYGGSMVNCDQYRWKKMVGPRDRRPPYAGTWYRYSTNGWGIPDFMDFCEAAGFLYVPDFDVNESSQDMADFIEYAKGPVESVWGRKRAADGHPQPYRLRYLELGNEERVDEKYFARFKPIAEAIWARDPKITLVVGDFFYHQQISDSMHFQGGAVSSLAAHKRILELAKSHGREVWFDIHVDTEAPPAPGDLAGPRSFYDQLQKLCPGARCKVVVFELNAGNHQQRRALSNALAILRIERDGRFPITTSANCLQPDGQNDNDWNQGLLFLNPSQVWLQPPGYVTQILSRNYQPQRVGCEVTAGENENERLEAVATRSDDKAIVLQVVNAAGSPMTARIAITGFAAKKPEAHVTELAGNLLAANTAEHTNRITPKQFAWKHGGAHESVSRVFPAHSFTVIRFE